MTDEEINESKNNYIVIDPGKRTILQMMQYKNNKTKILTYTSKQRTFEIKTNEFKKKLKNYKIKNKMIELETELSKTCCRTVDIEEFKNYIKKRNDIYDNMELLYEQSKCRRYKWYSFLNKKRSEDNIINNIKKTYGKDVTIFIGDWSNGTTQMKNFKSTPRIGIKRKLKKHFKVYNINEYNTSKMCYKTEKKTENLYIKNYKKTEGDKKEKEQIKLHAVLTYKMENNRTGCINRDKNSCFNMIKIVNEWITNKKRPLYLSIPIIDINPS